MKHLERHSTTGRLSYRRMYPAALRPLIPGNRRELKVSLQAAAITDAGALERFKAAAERYEASVAFARKAAAKAFDPLDGPLIARLAGTYIARELDRDDKAAWGGTHDRTYERRADLEDDYRDCRAMLEGRDRDGLTIFWRDWAVSYAAALGFMIDPASPDLPRLAFAMGAAKAKATANSDLDYLK